jgi:catechol 2,3-dioxygenase-like lactoylglutathione lyase family enzyme
MPNITSTSPILPVSDMERAVRFYESLGFQAAEYDATYVFLSRPGADIHLRKAPDLIEGENPSGVYFYLETECAALEAEFRSAGVKILSSLAPREWKMNEFMISDPDGNLLRFGERLPR